MLVCWLLAGLAGPLAVVRAAPAVSPSSAVPTELASILDSDSSSNVSDNDSPSSAPTGAATKIPADQVTVTGSRSPFKLQPTGTGLPKPDPNKGACASIHAVTATQKVEEGAIPTIPAQLAYDCMQSVPFAQDSANELLDSLEPYLEWQSNLDWVKDPPAEYAAKVQKGFDFRGAWQQIRANVSANAYASEYDFELSLYMATQQVHDGHFMYAPTMLRLFLFKRQVTLVSVSDDINQLPEVFAIEDIVNSAFGFTHNDPSPVKKINGMDVIDYLTELAQFGSLQDPDALWNSLFISPAHMAIGDSGTGTGMFSGGGRGIVHYPGPWTNLTFANGTTKASSNMALVGSPDFDQITSGTQVWEKIIEPNFTGDGKLYKQPSPADSTNSASNVDGNVSASSTSTATPDSDSSSGDDAESDAIGQDGNAESDPSPSQVSKTKSSADEGLWTAESSWPAGASAVTPAASPFPSFPSSFSSSTRPTSRRSSSVKPPKATNDPAKAGVKPTPSRPASTLSKSPAPRLSINPFSETWVPTWQPVVPTFLPTTTWGVDTWRPSTTAAVWAPSSSAPLAPGSWVPPSSSAAPGAWVPPSSSVGAAGSWQPASASSPAAWTPSAPAATTWSPPPVVASAAAGAWAPSSAVSPVAGAWTPAPAAGAWVASSAAAAVAGAWTPAPVASQAAAAVSAPVAAAVAKVVRRHALGSRDEQGDGNDTNSSSPSASSSPSSAASPPGPVSSATGPSKSGNSTGKAGDDDKSPQSSSKRRSMYPPAVLDNPDSNGNSGYFLDSHDDVAVLALRSFVNQGESDLKFQQTNRAFLYKALQEGKKKLIIDLSANGGGDILQAYDLFQRLFPSQHPESLSRWRSHSALQLLGQQTATLYYNDPKAWGRLSSDNSAIKIDEVAIWDFKKGMTQAGAPFSSWDQKYGPWPFGPGKDQFTSLIKLNISDPLEWEFAGNITVAGQGDEPLSSTQPFAPENIVLVYDGSCASTCALFSDLMRQQAKVRTVAMGGRPSKDIIQAVGGTKGAQVMQLEDIFTSVSNMQKIVRSSLIDKWSDTILGNYSNYPLLQTTASAAFNAADQIRAGDKEQTPLQFVYEPADCRMYYSRHMIIDQSVVWKAVADAAWGGRGGCVAGNLDSSPSSSNSSSSSSSSSGNSSSNAAARSSIASRSMTMKARAAPVRHLFSRDIVPGAILNSLNVNTGPLRTRGPGHIIP